MPEQLTHASCVSIHGKAVLIAGAPGAGKTDLALRLIDGGAELIADDQTLLQEESGVISATAPASIAGLIEVRHVGLLRMNCRKTAPVALYIDLAPPNEKIERLPEDDIISLLGIEVRRLRLPAFAASTPAKIRAALAYKMEK